MRASRMSERGGDRRVAAAAPGLHRGAPPLNLAALEQQLAQLNAELTLECAVHVLCFELNSSIERSVGRGSRTRPTET